MTSFSNFLTEPGWRAVLEDEFSKPYFASLDASLAKRLDAGAVIYPPRESIFSAFNLTPFDKVKVVILGQDPYHGAGQAMGLSFSVPAGVRVPPSLRNMLKEIDSDIGVPTSGDGDLTAWAEQGVLLLNSVLTVEEKKAGVHAKLGWTRFTDRAIAALAQNRSGIVFLLWGAFAHKKAEMIDGRKHAVLCAPHPSPLSAYRGFFDCGHFSKANAYLANGGKSEIQWDV